MFGLGQRLDDQRWLCSVHLLSAWRYQKYGPSLPPLATFKCTDHVLLKVIPGSTVATFCSWTSLPLVPVRRWTMTSSIVIHVVSSWNAVGPMQRSSHAFFAFIVQAGERDYCSSKDIDLWSLFILAGWGSAGLVWNSGTEEMAWYSTRRQLYLLSQTKFSNCIWYNISCLGPFKQMHYTMTWVSISCLDNLLLIGTLNSGAGSQGIGLFPPTLQWAVSDPLHLTNSLFNYFSFLIQPSVPEIFNL